MCIILIVSIWDSNIFKKIVIKYVYVSAMIQPINSE